MSQIEILNQKEIHFKISNQDFKFDGFVWYELELFLCDFHEKCCHDKEAHSYIFDSCIDSFAQGQMSSQKNIIKRECERMRAPPWIW